MKRFRIQTSCLTDQGKRRARNEDRFVLRTLDDGSRLMPLGLYAVLDGLGGHPEGDRAACLGKESLESLPVSELFPLWDHPETKDGSLSLESLERTLLDSLVKPFDPLEAQGLELPACVRTRILRICYGLAYRIYKENIAMGRRRPALMMGTTLVLAVVVGRKVVFANVGDSALLWIDAGGPIKLTHEQEDPLTGGLTQALGILPPDMIEPETGLFEIQNEGYLLLVSDGLSDLVSPNEMAEVAYRHRVAPLIAIELIDMANKRGGHDNITVVIVSFETQDPK